MDKTGILHDLVKESNNAVTLFTRPRRFGKTLMLSMMDSFFNIEKKSDSDVFDGLEVMEYKEFCEAYMNRYPVIFISLKDVEGRSFELAYGKLRTVIADICKKQVKHLSSEKVNRADFNIFESLMFGKAGEDTVQNSLKTIMRMMNAVYGKKVILLIDEYDVPLSKANANGYYREMLDVIRGLMSTSLKTNDYLEFAVVTGCLRIPKESIFTGVNNFAAYSVLDDDFSQYFGFVAEEVGRMLEHFDLSDKSDVIRQWYDGYMFGNTHLYCPWDVVNYVAALLRRHDAVPRNYWRNTGGNDAIRGFFDLTDTDITNEFETLLNGGVIYESVTNALTYDSAYKSAKGLWSILLMTGYVTTVPDERIRQQETAHEGDMEDQTVPLRIPNREIVGIFRTSVVEHFNETVDTGCISDLMNALWGGEEEKASQILSDLLWDTISYMDYSEDYYHAFLTGIFVGRGGYSVQSNKERGLGRPDIDLRDRRNHRAMIIEAKKSDNRQRMEYWCSEAISQIVRSGYSKGLEEDYNEIFCYGISFYKKKALVRLLRS